jgi:hypothetical protein
LSKKRGKRVTYIIDEGEIMNCAFCRGVIEIEGLVSRRDVCPHCDRDLRCCRQCKFYDPNAYNECREISAERIVDKERANLCDHFMLRGSKGTSGSTNKAKEAKKALEALFKKK